MYIIVIGAGEVGYNLAKLLSFEGHDIVVIDQDQERYSRTAETLDVQAILGNGTSYRILEQAGIKSADLLVAVTTNDEVNILAALMAKRYGVERTIARVRNAEFLNAKAPLNAKNLEIDLLIHPESETAKATIMLLKQTAATDVIEFCDGKVSLIGIQLDKTCPILEIPLSELAARYQNLVFRTIAIQRKDLTKIPKGDDVFLPNDRIFVITKTEAIPDVIRLAGKENEKIENIMILGGGQIGYLIAEELEKDHNVKLIEASVDKSQELAEKLAKSLVIQGDGRDINLLAVEGIIDMDAFIAATGDDETNIISCLLAKHLQVSRIISLINKPAYTPILPTIGIDAYLSKQMITVNGILKFIRRGEIVSVASIPGIAAEAIEMIPKPGSKITQKPLADLHFPHNAILGAVMRQDTVFIPVGNTHIQPGDKVVIFAMPSAIREVEEMFN
ncbi:MAG: Trk system potassium transporter TrkA [candidate division KSB1 bacterium]|nr:Trk system potassium transporter TrkA [candidate division KSB1 bacterium]